MSSDSDSGSVSDPETWFAYGPPRRCHVTLSMLERLAIQLRNIAYTLKHLAPCGESKERDEMDNAMSAIREAVESLPESVHMKAVTVRWDSKDGPSKKVGVRSTGALRDKVCRFISDTRTEPYTNSLTQYWLLDGKLVHSAPANYCDSAYIEYNDEVAWDTIRDESELVVSIRSRS